MIELIDSRSKLITRRQLCGTEFQPMINLQIKYKQEMHLGVLTYKDHDKKKTQVTRATIYSQISQLKSCFSYLRLQNFSLCRVNSIFPGSRTQHLNKCHNVLFFCAFSFICRGIERHSRKVQEKH